MILYVDTVTRKLRRSVADSREVNSLQFKRGDSAEIQLVFVTSGVQVELADGTTITFGIKADGIFDGEFLVSTSDFTLSGEGATAVYTGNPSFNTTALNTALGVDLSTANDIAKIKVGVEISWEDGGDSSITSTDTIIGYVFNDVIKGDEGTPEESATPDDEWVAHGHAQTLTLAQKTQALQNIGADRKFVAKSVSEQTPTSSVNILAGLRYQFVEVTSSAEVDPGATSQKLGLPVTDVLAGDVIEIRLKTLSTTPANLPLNLYTRNPGPGTWTTLLASLRNVGDSIRLTCLTASASVTTWMIEPFLPRYASLSAANAAEAAIGIVFWNTTSGKAQVTTATS